MTKRSRLLGARTHQRTIVTMTSGEVFDGLLAGFDGTVVQMAGASMIGTGDQAIKRAEVDGLLLLPWSQVAYMQCP